MYRRTYIPFAAVALVLISASAIHAQTPTGGSSGGRQQSRDKTVLAGAETVFPMDDNLVLRGYSNRRWIARPSQVAHAVMMIHGVLRNPDHYYLLAKRALERKSLFSNVALVSVGFDDSSSAPKDLQHLALFGSHWKHGDFGGPSPDDPHNRLSSFAAMDRVLLDLTRTYPNLKRITLIGHSAGGQFVDRYSVLSPIAAKAPKVELQFVALAPSTVLYPDRLRPQVKKGGKVSFSTPAEPRDYDEYPYGLSPTPLLRRLVGQPVTDRTEFVKRLVARNIVFAVGSEDTTEDYLDQSDCADTEGPNRYLRMKYFVEFMKTHYNAPNHRLLRIAGVGHNSQRLIRSPEMSKFFSER